ncbi:MAG: spore germination protein [Syntrophomonadaceae bacterium]|nr:spore germination protein [Syntrophomonadaceae bacterium]
MFKKQDIELNSDYDRTLDLIKKELGEGESFDIVVREFKIAGQKSALIGIDGLIKDDVMTWIMQSLFLLKDSRSEHIKSTLQTAIPYIELSREDNIDELLYLVLSGSVLLVVDGLKELLVIDARTYPSRNPEEAEIERVVRGSRDGFTETIVFNTALLRRRVRDPKLRIKMMRVGRRSKSDVCLCYIKDIADPDLVATISSKIEAIEIDAVPMAEKAIEELIVPGNWWNPFPRVRYTERPDVAAAHLFEGHVLVMVDTSPSVIIAPATYFHHIQHAEEYRQNPVVGSYIRGVRFLAVMASIIITPLWMLFALSPELLPDFLEFIGPKKIGQVPVFIQFIIAELSLDLIRMAAIHTPSPLATALGVIAALLIGDIAVNIGLFAPEIILYTAVVAVGSYCTPSYEMAMANRLVRFFILLATGFFKLPGLIISSILSLLLVAFTRSFDVPYLWPLIPFNYRAFKSIIIRSPVPIQNLRPEVLHPRDRRRQPVPALKRRNK